MYIKKLMAYSAIVLLVLAGSFLLLVGTAHAQPVSGQEFIGSECSQGTMTYYDARTEVKPDTYDVFVKMGKRGQTAETTLYIENSDATSCETVGATTANGDSWQKLGTWTSSSNKAVRFQLASEIFNGQPNANRPTIMLVPHNNPPCQPSVNCDFVFEGTPAYISPTGTLLNEDTLHVVQVHSLEGDKVKQVDYYADGQLLYTTPSLETFNLRYVPGGDHTLSRVIQYQSGQKVVLQSSAYVSFAQDFQNLLFRLFNSNKVGLQILTVITILVLACLIVLAVVRALHRRHVWRLNHGIIQQDMALPTAATHENYVPPPHYLNPDSKLMTIAKHATPIIVVAVIALACIGITDAYAAQLFRVDGPSMQTTLYTGEQLFTNKLPKTWATLNHQEYVPKRGEIIIFQKAHSKLFLENNEDEGNVFVVKRVLGLPGERVTIRDGVVTIYNKEHPAGFNPDETGSWKKNLTIDTTENIDVTLSQGEVFVAGDNRPESLDSRANGPIDVKDIIGRVEARVLPFSSRRKL